MSEQQTENTPTQAEQTGQTTFPLSFVKRETGRTHTVVSNGVQSTVPITHGETGELETEYVLVVTIDGAEVPLATYNSGRIDTIVKSQQARQSSETQV